jgi:hypothetical protein
MLQWMYLLHSVATNRHTAVYPDECVYRRLPLRCSGFGKMKKDVELLIH